MLSKDLLELIQEIRKNGSEDNRIEIKKAAGGCPKIYDTLSSFSFPINPEAALLFSV